MVHIRCASASPPRSSSFATAPPPVRMSTTEDDESAALLKRLAGDGAAPPLRPADAPTLSAALSDAAATGSAEAVRLALERGAPVDAKSRYGQSALMVATREGYVDAVDVVAELLHHGADAGIRDVFGKTPLSTAAFCGHAAVVTELLANGAVVDMADASGNTPLMSAATLRTTSEAARCRSQRVRTRSWSSRSCLVAAPRSTPRTSKEELRWRTRLKGARWMPQQSYFGTARMSTAWTSVAALRCSKRRRRGAQAPCTSNW